ncbi:MAG TPA: hypothetical protein PLQ00_10700, partial [Thermoguttaceae bacterium]|nr:hypothetical protein [Thermoguttaceae bacterium]
MGGVPKHLRGRFQYIPGSSGGQLPKFLGGFLPELFPKPFGSLFAYFLNDFFAGLFPRPFEPKFQAREIGNSKNHVYYTE